jgi:superfamily II DNA or RNA helicase
MATFSDLVASFDADANRRGKQFEHFVKWFLHNDPEWRTQIDKVWLWSEYPERWGIDCGIDLVFRHKNGDIWAVQAKCYSKHYDITKHDVDKFLSESNRKGIAKRLLIATTDRIGTNAKQVCEAQEKQVFRYMLSNFESANLEYPATIDALHTAKRKPRPTPREHQLEAIDDVVDSLKRADKGQLIMACGTGKTFTTLWIKEQLNATSTLILLPSLGLLSQTLHEWTLAANSPFEVLCICSDNTVGKTGTDETIHSVADIAFPVTSDIEDIRQFLIRDGVKVVFSTYQSSPLIAEAQAVTTVPDFDLAIADEAHRCTGKVGNDFTTILNEKKIRSKKRLFATATPRTYQTNTKIAANERGVDIVGMNDESVFGEVLHTLPFGEAIKRGLLTDYQVVIVGVDNPMIATWIENRELVKTVSGFEIDAESLAVQIGLLKAYKDYDLRRVISFHSRVNRAEQFSKNFLEVLNWIGDEHKPDGKLHADFVSGEMPTDKRRNKLTQLRALAPKERRLLTNARCLSEGVDVPSLDGVAFIDPRSSQTDIIQAVGRAIRLSASKTTGTIILPVFIETDNEAQASIEASNFKPIWNVLNALKAHDEVLSAELDRIRHEMGRKGSSTVSSNALSKIHINLPSSIDEHFGESLRTCLVEKTSDTWEYGYGALKGYSEQNGNCSVHFEYTLPCGFKLGSWVKRQRSEKGILTSDRRGKLDYLSGWVWNIHEALWEEGFAELKKFIAIKGHSRVSMKRNEDATQSESGYLLGSWIGRQRHFYQKGILSQDRIARLEALPGWLWNTLSADWENGFSYLQEYVLTVGDAVVPQSFVTNDSFQLGVWVTTQRRNFTSLEINRRMRLEALKGWSWDRSSDKWEEGFSQLIAHVEKYGNSLVTQSFTTKDGYRLGQWIGEQRTNKKIRLDRKKRLETVLDWAWNANDSLWEIGISHVKSFVKETGHYRVPQSYITVDGYALGKWVNSQRVTHSRGGMRLDRIERLEALSGWEWSKKISDISASVPPIIFFLMEDDARIATDQAREK